MPTLVSALLTWTNATVTIAALLASAILFTLYPRRRSRLPLPPGPRKLPIFGNLFDLPKTFEWMKYAEWSQELNSDIIHIDMAGTSVIVVNSQEIANDLFEKRSAIYSSRPRFVMMNELMGWSWLFAFMPYGDYWRAHRRLFHQEFHPQATLRYQPHELKVTRETLIRFLDDPDNFMSHIRHVTGSIIMSISYGITVLPENDPYIETAEKALYSLCQAAIPGRFLVDSLPFLRWIPDWMPGTGFKKLAKEWREDATKMVNAPFKAVLKDGTGEPSFVTYALENVDPDKDIKFQYDVIRQTAGNMYTGGSDTTVSALNTFILAMLCNPEAQRKGQEELDKVIGSGRLPDFEDEESLPYISAIVKEVIRWQPVTPIAVPHYLTMDDVYKGYHLPKDSTVIGNAWAMCHDEKMYPNPTKFHPDRWLKDGKLNPDVREPTAVFGFGRRICPGRHLALSSVFIFASTMLSTFNITKATDEDGKEIEPDPNAYHSALICHALPFRCRITPRSRGAEVLIRSSDVACM